MTSDQAGWERARDTGVRPGEKGQPPRVEWWWRWRESLELTRQQFDGDFSLGSRQAGGWEGKDIDQGDSHILAY